MFQKAAVVIGAVFCAVLLISAFSVNGAVAACTAAPTGMTNWWGGDNNALDIVGPHNGTLNGDTAYIAGQVGQAFSFDGSGDYVALPVSTDWDFGTGSFSISAWFKAGASADYQNIIVYHNGGAGTGYWYLRLTPAGNVQVVIGDAAGWPAESLISSTSAFNDNAWHFATGVRDGATGELRLYVDGAEATAAVSDGARDVIGVAGTYPTIGGAGMFSTQFVSGLVDELQIFGRAFSLAEHQAEFNAGTDGNCRPCEAQPAGAVALWRAENNGADSVGTHDGVPTGSPTFAAGLNGQALNVGGTDDYLTVPHHADLRFGAADNMTVAAWVYRTGTDTTMHILSKRSSCGLNDFNYQLVLDPTGGRGLCFVSGNTDNMACSMGGDADLPMNKWTFVAGTYDSTTLRLYIDGALAASDPGTLVLEPTPAPLTIGSVGPCAGQDFDGLIDEAAIYNVALTGDQLASIYNAGATGICGSCVDQPTGMTNWWGGDGNAVDIAGPHNGTLNGDTTYAAGKVGDAFSFDGNGDYVTLPVSTDWDFGTGSFSLSAWFNSSAATGLFRNVIRYHDGGSTGGYWGLRTNDSNNLTFTIRDAAGSGSQSVIASTGTYNDGSWHLVTAVRDAGTGFLRLYVDGTEAATAVAEPGWDVTANAGTYPAIGRVPALGNEFWDGLLDEVQVFGRALSREEHQAAFTAGSGGVCRSCAPRPAGLAAWWQGEGDATDFTGTDDGTLLNGATFAPGLVGQTFSFDGVDDRIEFASGTADFGADPFTVEFLLRVPSSELVQLENYIMGKSHIIDGGWEIRINNNVLADGKIVVTGMNGWVYNIKSTDPIAADQWHHVALVGSASNADLYVNGTLQGTSVRSGIISARNPFSIGMHSPGSFGSPLQGRVDEAAIYSRALTAAEVADIANARCAGKCTSIDSVPDAFAFTDQTDVPSNSERTSNTITVAGIDIPSPISISSCSGTLCGYSVNGGIFTGGAGTVSNGDTVQVRQTSSSSGATKTDLVLDIGGVTDTFSVTTITQYAVTAEATGNGTGSVSSDVDGINYTYPAITTGTTVGLDAGTSVVITATAGLGSTVALGDCAAAGGTPGGNTTTATCTFSSLSQNRTVTATFTLTQYSVQADAAGNGAGVVSSSPAGINYSYPGTATGTAAGIDHGTTVILTATAAAGSTASWNDCAGAGGTPSDNDTGTATCTFASLSEHETATATFTLNQYSVQANADGNGGGVVASSPAGINYNYPATATGSVAGIDHGTAVTLTAAAGTGSTASWNDCAGAGGTPSGNGTGTSTCSFSPLVGNESVTASFTLDTFTLTVSKTGLGLGTVTSDPAGIDCGTDCTDVYAYGKVVNLTADPHPRALSAGFTGDADCSDGSVTMNADVSCTAGFSSLGDWNVDGTPDMAFRNPTDGKNALLYLVANAKAGIDFLVPAPTSLDFAGAADLDDDGFMDLILRDRVTGLLIAAYFNGKEYRHYKTLPFKTAPWELSGTGDHNDDKKADLFWTNPVTGENEVVYLSAAVSIGSDTLPKAPLPWKVEAIDDMNGDGVLDLIARNSETGMFAAGFLAGTNLAGKGIMPTAPLSQEFVGTMDINGDGKPDIVLRDPATGKNEAWYMDGTKRIGSPVKLPTAPPPWEGMTGYK